MSDLVQEPLPQRTVVGRRRWLLSLAMLSGAVLSLSLFAILARQERAAVRGEVELQLNRAAQDLQRVSDQYLEVLESVRAFYSASQEVERDEFLLFAWGPLARLKGLRALQWAPHVPAADRENLEQLARNEGVGGFQIFDRNPEGRLVPAAARDAYFPIYFIAPAEPNRALLGFDLASQPANARAMNRAGDEFVPAATTEIARDDGSGSPLLCTVFVPIYHNDAPLGTVDERRRNLLGFAAAQFDLGKMTDEALEPPIAEGLAVRLVHEDGSESGQILYQSPSFAAATEPLRDRPCAHAEQISLADQRWTLRCFATPAYLHAHRRWEAWAVLAGSLIVSALVCALLWATLGRTARVEALVQQRTNELARANTELAAAKQAAEAANRAKSAFLAAMSHEIRTPMGAIIGLTDLVLETGLTAVQRDYLKMVQESGESLLSLLNDILDFSKIEAGRLELEQVVFGLRERLGDTLKSLAHRAHDKDLELACQVAPATPDALVGDPGRLRQLIVNLVGNAIKFTERGEVVLRVEPQSQSAQEVTLHLVVTDTGIGIPPDTLDRIFRPFEQADSSTTRKYGGTGLGLAIAKRLVGLLGGEIWVESEVGRGSSFHCTLRFGLAELPPPESPSVSPVPIQNVRALVVDDNATNRLILEEMLRNWGMQPTSVPSARAALEALRGADQAGEPFRIVLTDCHMPEQDGFQFVEQFRREPHAQGAVIMMLSSASGTDDIERCERLGIATHLLKPLKQSELLAAVAAALGAATLAEHPAAADRAAELRQLPPLRILVAEDGLVNQKLARSLLQRFGHSVVVASTGREAVSAWESQPFDLILMDVQMPEMDGLEATAVIRASERRTGQHIPIIAMTAHAMKGDRERCLAAGMDGYVSKPVRAQKLAAAIHDVLATAPRPDTAPAQPAAPPPA